ncbi:MAG: adenylate/guanylate cyclase domain-containing protein [Chthoniobacteraceae bacterium]
MAAPQKSRWRGLLRLASSVLGALLLGAIGWVLAQTSFSVGTFGERKATRFGWLCTSLGESLARLSYDLPFVVRGTVEVAKSCIVYMDEDSARKLGQTGAIWDRKLHAQLLDALVADKPRGIFFDVVFSDASAEPGVDEEFAEAMKKGGNVFLAGALETDAGVVGANGRRISSQRVIPPIAMLRAAAAGWGVIAFQPIDGDYGVRRISPGTETVPSAPWRAAVKLGAALENTPESWLQPRWENYYGPAGAAESVGYDRVILQENRLAPGYFTDRIVVVGGRSTLGGLAFGKDDFRNPFSVLGGAFSTGAEVHLTALLNLLNGDWLTRLDARHELGIAILIGVVFGGALPRFRPHIAALLAVLAIVGIGAFACWLSVAHRVWFAWCVPAFVQVPVALLWAVGARYFLEERRRSALRNAFGHYLSPHIADRIADSDFDLSPGGSVAEVSVLFTDLEGFTTLTEELNNPELMTQILLKYFAQTTAPILQNDGMIVNFVGDAVTAVWGAPLAEPDHARKAALAAWRLHESARIEVDGHKLRTRVGLHTGRVLAGNVGSAERFDYAVVGDPVNFASRLEGLNKYFGTNVLISDAIRQKLGGDFIARRLGEFRVVGKKDACVIHEFLGPASAVARPHWCAPFEKGVAAFCTGDFHTAAQRMRETLAIRDGTDGPAQFYLDQIARHENTTLPADWTGIVEFSGK